MAKKATTTSPRTVKPGARTQLSARQQGRRMGRKPPPEGETRHERFKRIGTKRVNNAIRQIQLLGNLCGANYECDANDLALMRGVIIRELDMALARFTPRKRTGGKGFSFDNPPQELSPTLANEDQVH